MPAIPLSNPTHTLAASATRLADLNNLEILIRGAPVQQDVVDLTIPVSYTHLTLPTKA